MSVTIGFIFSVYIQQLATSVIIDLYHMSINYHLFNTTKNKGNDISN